ncbi:MAG: hypothetical protein CMM01_20930 [Rhodopirellula sp.]|nr:hypothetical protein [Rhodopirellula sp.]
MTFGEAPRFRHRGFGWYGNECLDTLIDRTVAIAQPTPHTPQIGKAQPDDRSKFSGWLPRQSDRGPTSITQCVGLTSHAARSGFWQKETTVGSESKKSASENLPRLPQPRTKLLRTNTRSSNSPK